MGSACLAPGSAAAAVRCSWLAAGLRCCRLAAGAVSASWLGASESSRMEVAGWRFGGGAPASSASPAVQTAGAISGAIDAAAGAACVAGVVVGRMVWAAFRASCGAAAGGTVVRGTFTFGAAAWSSAGVVGVAAEATGAAGAATAAHGVTVAKLPRSTLTHRSPVLQTMTAPSPSKVPVPNSLVTREAVTPSVRMENEVGDGKAEMAARPVGVCHSPYRAARTCISQKSWAWAENPCINCTCVIAGSAMALTKGLKSTVLCT
mmetsp:Transcript_89019/g.203628  ORF Transcript_89019/g.203628 Transcript_89019/m.203628 type:complete len:262 (+) Transcript_89019:993-1778(+)